ncbi:MAG: hypothetical protein P8I83_03645 [Paracoccaceae bacterium]|nr:hypothetical protein [Paracoccaceae bacterium]
MVKLPITLGQGLFMHAGFPGVALSYNASNRSTDAEGFTRGTLEVRFGLKV